MFVALAIRIGRRIPALSPRYVLIVLLVLFQHHITVPAITVLRQHGLQPLLIGFGRRAALALFFAAFTFFLATAPTTTAP
jgi:hypothetical protein